MYILEKMEDGKVTYPTLTRAFYGYGGKGSIFEKRQMVKLPNPHQRAHFMGSEGSGKRDGRKWKSDYDWDGGRVGWLTSNACILLK